MTTIHIPDKDGLILTIGGEPSIPSEIPTTEQLRQTLFSENQLGGMYIPQPTVDTVQVLYQVYGSTTEVTAASQVIGMQLDYSQQAARGLELVPTPDSMDAGFWTISGDTVTIADGVATFTDSGTAQGFNSAAQNILELEKWYELEVVVDSITSGTLRAYASIGGSSTYGTLAVGTNNLILKATGTEEGISIIAIGTTNAVVSSVSAREIFGYHAYQEAAPARPMYSDTPPLQVFDAVDDQLNVTLPAIAAATIATATPTGTVIQYPVDLSAGTYAIVENNSGIIIREGELTPSEQQSVINYLDNLAGV